MGSYENIVKLEEMRRRMEEGDVLSAQKIFDTMDSRKIKNMADLNLMAEVLMDNERYDEAVELFLKINNKTKTRKSLYQLIIVSIKRKNAVDAEQYLAQYQSIAPNDFYKYIFRYKIDKMNGEDYDKLIESLETLKKTEYTEQWAYELAKLYYKAGMEEECIRECTDIVLWFGDGIYVEKAKMLRSYYSGEAGKDRILEELKRRSNKESSNGELEEQTKQSHSDQEIEAKLTVSSDRSEEEICSTTNFAVEEDIIDFVDALKKNVQDILTDGWKED